MKGQVNAVNKAYSALHVKSVAQDTEYVYIEGIASTPTPDRDLDIVNPMGARFKTPMALLMNHRGDLPVGNVTFAQPSAKGIPFKARLPLIKEAGILKDRVDEAIQSLKYKLIGFVSIGFRPVQGEYEFIENGGIKFLQWDWYELSLTAIPAQPEAVITSVKSLGANDEPEPLSAEVIRAIKSIDEQQRAASGIPAAVRLTSARVGVKSLPVVKSIPDEVNTMKTIAEQIEDFKKTRLEKAQKMSTIMQKAGDAGVTLDAAESEEYDTLADEVQAIDKHLERLEKSQALQVKSAAPVNTVPNGAQALEFQKNVQVGAKRTEKLEPGIAFTRYAMCKLAAKGNPLMAAELAKSHYPDNEAIVKTLEAEARGVQLPNLMKAVVEAGTTLDATFAAPLVDYQNFSGDFVEYLRPRTIIGQFGQGSIPALNRIPFNVRIAGQTSGGSAAWVGEGAPKPLTQFDFNATELRWSKVAAIAVLTNELIRFSNPSAERLVRDALGAAVIERIDTDFVLPSKAAVANVSPASITNGATAIASAGASAANIRTDIQRLWAPFIAARNPPRSAVYLMNSSVALSLSLMQNPLGQSEFPGLTMNGGTFMGVPVIVSDYIPYTTAGSIVILVNASDIWLADDGQVTINASSEASLQMDNAPTNNSATGTGTSLVSMFQTNSTAYLAERYINWARRRASGVAYLTGVNWGE